MKKTALFAIVILLVILILVIIFSAVSLKETMKNNNSNNKIDVPSETDYTPVSEETTNYVYFEDRNVYLLPFSYLDFSIPYHRWMYYYYPEFYYSYYDAYWPFRTPRVHYYGHYKPGSSKPHWKYPKSSVVGKKPSYSRSNRPGYSKPSRSRSLSPSRSRPSSPLPRQRRERFEQVDTQETFAPISDNPPMCEKIAQRAGNNKMTQFALKANSVSHIFNPKCSVTPINQEANDLFWKL